MIEYSFNIGSKIDRKLIAAWQEWDGYNQSHRNWIKFLETLPGVESTNFMYRTFTIVFEHESALSLFLLRWS